MTTHKKFECTSYGTKSETFAKLKLWKDEVENHIGRKIKCLQLDNGTEYAVSRFSKLCEEHGIKRHFAV